jgi:hypothetical protein
MAGLGDRRNAPGFWWENLKKETTCKVGRMWKDNSQMDFKDIG